MSSYLADQICSPPDLPPYLKRVCDLKPIVGIPSDDEMIGVHAVIRVANKVVDVQELGDPGLLARLSEHLFEAQMARYRGKYPLGIFPIAGLLSPLVSDAIYVPPVLPAHVSVNLESVSGAPSGEQVIKVHEAIRSYRKCSEIPSMFDPHIDAELSQYLFNIQMAKFMSSFQRQPDSASRETTRPPISAGVIERTTEVTEEPTTTSSSTNNTRTGVVTVEPQSGQEPQPTLRCAHGVNGHEVMERSNQLVERLSEVLGDINKVLVGIQHTMVRGQFGEDVEYNIRGMGRMVNHKGDIVETRGFLTREGGYSSLSVWFRIRGRLLSISVPDTRLVEYLTFYGLEEGLCYEDGSVLRVKEGLEALARERLGHYLAARVG